MPGQQRPAPFRDNRGIGAVRVLSPAEHVKVSEPYGLNPVRLCKDICVEFVDVFGDRIGGKWPADLVFNLGEIWMIAIR